MSCPVTHLCASDEESWRRAEKGDLIIYFTALAAVGRGRGSTQPIFWGGHSDRFRKTENWGQREGGSQLLSVLDSGVLCGLLSQEAVVTVSSLGGSNQVVKQDKPVTVAWGGDGVSVQSFCSSFPAGGALFSFLPGFHDERLRQRLTKWRRGCQASVSS
jgi:hypothetical protein